MVLLADAEIVSTRSRPKAAGRQAGHFLHRVFVSTHSRPKAAGKAVSASAKVLPVSTHSRPKAAGGFVANKGRHREFQLTAARRRLDRRRCRQIRGVCFNSQPPEGGW